jgi:hypothetical protein
MGEININDFVEVAGMASMNGFRRFMKWQGELVLDREKFIVIEDLEGQPIIYMKKDIKPGSVKKIKKFENVI